MNDEDLAQKKELLKKLRTVRQNLKNNRMKKNIREEYQIKALKENPLFQNANGNDQEMKNIINKTVSQLSNDPKQKKNLKKQMENLIDKMKTV